MKTIPTQTNVKQAASCQKPSTSPTNAETGCGSIPIFNAPPEDTSCCGPPAGPESSPHEKPGYRLCHFVDGFIPIPNGSVPRIKTQLEKRDYLGTVRARLGIARNNYKIAPGLYGAGKPDEKSAVLVTANYKLTFDALRRELTDIPAWILVLDTRGINVWCAAGKRTFSTDEVIHRVHQTRLDQIVTHRNLILPQLSATGVSGRQVRKGCGFKVVWGPVTAADLRQFVTDGMKAHKDMRRVTFSFLERMVLTPVELSALPKPFFWAVLAILLLSGIGPHIFSFGQAWTRGVIMILALITGILTGAIAAPALLPWIPGKAFAFKGALMGVIGGLAISLFLYRNISGLEAIALFLLTAVVSSYLTMNFTGSTPYTSPSGVEKEMRRAIPVQAAATLLVMVFWISAAF